MLGVAALALGLRVAYLNPGFFHHDAVLLAEAVVRTLETGRLAPLLEGRYAYVAFHVPFGALCRALGLPLDVSFNLLTAVLAALSTALTWIFTRQLGVGRFAALSAALVLAVTPVYFSISTHAMVHPFSVCAVLLAFVLLLEAERRDAPPLYAAAALAFLVATSARLPNALLLAPFLLIHLEPRWRGGRLAFRPGAFGRNLLALAVPLALGLPGLWLLHQQAIAERVGRELLLDDPWRTLRVVAASLHASFAGLGLLLFAGGVLLVPWQRRRACLLALLLWIALLSVFYASIAVFDLRYHSVVLPCVALFIGCALQALWRRSRLVASVLLLVLVAQLFGQVRPLVALRHGFSGPKQHALWLREQTEPDALVIAMDDAPFVRWYAQRRTQEHPVGSEPEARRWTQALAAEIRAGTPVYVMESGLSYDPEGVIRRLLRRRFRIVKVGLHPSEDYHKSELELKVYAPRLYRLELRDR